MRIITAEQAVRHPARNQLTRSLGAELFLNVDVAGDPSSRVTSSCSAATASGAR